MSALSSDVSTLGSFSQFSIEEYLGEFAPTPQRSSSDTERSNDAEGCEAHAASSITSAARSVNLRKSLPPPNRCSSPFLGFSLCQACRGGEGV